MSAHTDISFCEIKSEAKMSDFNRDFNENVNECDDDEAIDQVVSAFEELNQDFDDDYDDDDDFDEERIRKASSTSLHANPVFTMKRPSIDVPFAMKRPSVDVPFATQPTIPEMEYSSTPPCPFKELPDHDTLVERLKNLPEFKEGCSFKGSTDMSRVFEKVETMAHENETFAEALKGIVEEANKPKEYPQEWNDVAEHLMEEGGRILASLDAARWDLRLEAEEPLRTRPAETTTTTTTMSRELSDALKADTQEAHRRAETCEFMHAFVKGSVTMELYREFLGALYYVYEAMEREMERHKDNAVIATVYFPTELNRIEYLEEDMRFYYGDDWRERYLPSEGCKQYVARIRELGDKEPELLVAHHYTRYLGDISGGQTLKKKAQKAWVLGDADEENKGVKFYYFPHVPDPNNFKRMYRARLNVIGENKELADKLVKESNNVYDLNTTLFLEMDARAKVINGFSNVRPDQVQERLELEESRSEPRQRKPICPVMSGNLPLDQTMSLSNPHAPGKTQELCPMNGIGAKLIGGVYHVVEPVVVMALASMLTLVLHASDMI